MMTKPKLLILNGSILGNRGNCGILIRHICTTYSNFFNITTVHLKTLGSKKKLMEQIATCQGLLVVTGTYWDSWGSPLQMFFEEFTDLEASKSILGKPAGVIALCHSVGGKSVMTRLQGNLNLFGFLIPPFSGIELSMLSLSILKNKKKNYLEKDLWGPKDLDILINNLQAALNKSKEYKAWQVDSKNFRKNWLQL